MQVFGRVTAENGGARRAQAGNYYYYDNRQFHDVTPDVMARLESRMRSEKPKWIRDAKEAMRAERRANPHAYARGT